MSNDEPLGASKQGEDIIRMAEWEVSAGEDGKKMTRTGRMGPGLRECCLGIQSTCMGWRGVGGGGALRSLGGVGVW